jgi:hypothetical protein
MFKEIFTDSKGRTEVKMILGVPLLIAAVVYGMASQDWIGFGALSATALGLAGLTTAGDAAIDKAKP